MKEIKIEHLAYLLKQAKKNNQPQPIFFLGAGASHSGNIPLAGEIVTRILNDYADSPFIRDLKIEEKTYANLMNCLLPDQRDELLKKYIDDAKINVTHIYLAQLVNEGFVDYVLTVNFDNLMLRSLALFNIFPSTYDMAILKDFTTSTFKEKSLVYLHGQNHGLWLLNTPEEMERVKNTVPRIFDTIKNKRPWVFIGYSGEDPIFEHVKNLGRFNNGLYWITFIDNLPNETVQKFLSEPNTNASIITGYDSDSFMLKLNSELELGQPNIVDKPFTALKEMLNEIVDIDDKEYFKGAKERLEISKRQVDEAIQQYELGIVESEKESKENSEIDLLKKEIINIIISENYQEDVISSIEIKVKKIHNENLKSKLAMLYINWANSLDNLAIKKEGKDAEKLYKLSIEKYQKAIEIKPDINEGYNDWGITLAHFAKTKEGKEAEELYKQAFDKYQKAIEIKPDNHESFNCWGIDLGDLVKTKEGKEAEELYKQAFDKFQKSIEIIPDYHHAFNNWGRLLGDLAKIKKGKESEELYNQAFDKYQKAIEIKPDKFQTFWNWGNQLGELAKTKKGKESEELFNQAFEKYQKSIEIKPNYYYAFCNWGACLGFLAINKEGRESEELFKQAFDKFQQAIKIKPDKHEAFYNWGKLLGDLAIKKEGKESEELYKQAFDKFQTTIEMKPDIYEAYYYWGIYLGDLAITKEGKESEELYNQAFDKFQKVIKIKPDFYEAFFKWGACLLYLAQTKQGKEEEQLKQISNEKFEKALEFSKKNNAVCL